jgi:hypothetical protein
MWCVAQDSGNVVVKDNGGRVTWQAGTAGGDGYAFTMQADGNLVLYK